MKTITIGRGDGCDIKIEHSKISRRHAILKVYTFGKIEIVDMGQNGTWVNGVKLRPGVPFPIKRKDVVNFAEVSQLNWSRVPNPTKCLKLASAIVACLVLLIVLFIMFAANCSNSSYNHDDSYLSPVSSEQNIDGNISKEISSEKQSPSDNSTEQGKTKEAENDNAETDISGLPNNKARTKTAEELFPFINNKKNDSTKKDSGKKKEDEKQSKEKKSEKTTQKVEII